MREPEDMGWYVETGKDGEPRAVHGIKRLMPEGAKEISEAEAKQISAGLRARAPESAADVSQPGAPVDLQPLQDQITRIAQVVKGHAESLDEHKSSIDQHKSKIEDVSRSVKSFMEGQKNLAGGEG